MVGVWLGLRQDELVVDMSAVMFVMFSMLVALSVALEL